MSIKTEILQKDAPVLRETAESVLPKDIKSKKIQNIISKMKKAMHAEEDGVAIAAPQIGESLRIFVVKGQFAGTSTDAIFINPEIIKVSKRKKEVEEGCLSVRWLYGQVSRSERVTVKACNENGKVFQRGATKLLAQIFQHETDHLDGILFTDKAKNIQTASPQFAFFGTDEFAVKVLAELNRLGLRPALVVTTPDT